MVKFRPQATSAGGPVGRKYRVDSEDCGRGGVGASDLTMQSGMQCCGRQMRALERTGGQGRAGQERTGQG
eukprot:766037-Hanusia_phi.AAC.1